MAVDERDLARFEQPAHMEVVAKGLGVEGLGGGGVDGVANGHGLHSKVLNTEKV